jgi:hypothetical protein
VDWNSDGDADLVSGDRNGYFNVWVWDDTGFIAYTQYQKTDSTPLNVGANSYPTVIDWNADGKKDLLIGCENGQVLFWPNLTSDTWPMFQTVETVAVGGDPLYLYRANPVVFDLDQDGVNDLVCGADAGYVLFYRNTGTNSEPDLAAAETLKTPRGLPVQSGGSPYGSRCWFGFWDADSLPDILLSAYDGNVELFHGVLPVGVEEGKPALACLALRAGPSPTTGRTTIWCEVPASAELVVCDDLGRVVRHLGVTSGRSVRSWDGRNDSGAEVNSGVYFCRLTGSGQTASARIVLSR